MNKTSLKILGYSEKDEIYNKQIIEFFSSNEVINIDDIYNGYNRFRCKNNNIIDVNILFSNYDNKYILIFNDVSNLKTAENKIDTLLIENKKLSKQKDDFIWQLGHDLKTPIASIVTLLPIIEKRINDPELKEMIKRVLNNSIILKNEVNKILDVAKVKAFGTSLELKDYNLYDIVQPIITEYTNLFSEKEIIISNEINNDLFVKVDKDQLIKVFNQLLSNSLKYSANGSYITFFAEDSGDYIRIEFEDTGSGVEKEVLDHLFEEFYKADDSRHDLSSSGLGLPICKSIIESFGGEIKAHSLGSEKGLSFYISLKKGVKKTLF